MKHKLLWVGLVLIIAVVALLTVPIVNNYGTPAWSEDGGTFLHNVGKALKSYSLEHNGKMPVTLASLYPEYISDKRVLAQTAPFGKRMMAVIYWHPKQLHNSERPVVQLVLDPSVKTDYPWRSIVLWGDGQVRLYKMQRK